MKVTHKDYFPTRIWTFDASELLIHHDVWTSYIHQWRQNKPTPAGRSNRKGWNSDKTVFNQDLFKPLKAAAHAAFLHAFKEMQLASDFKFFVEAWVNLHDQGGFNNLHMHPNVLLSGSYYIQTPEGAGPIVFRDPRPGALLVEFSGHGIHCNSSVTIQPKAGQMVVFPNWLEHRVEVNESQEPRTCIAMNARFA